jgi:hypothetical protein
MGLNKLSGGVRGEQGRIAPNFQIKHSKIEKRHIQFEKKSLFFSVSEGPVGFISVLLCSHFPQFLRISPLTLLGRVPKSCMHGGRTRIPAEMSEILMPLTDVISFLRTGRKAQCLPNG